MIKKSIHKEADLRNKLTATGVVLEQVNKNLSSNFIKLALKDLDYAEQEFGLKKKLSKVRMILEALAESKQPSEKSIKLAAIDFELIKNAIS
jgi:hypothetical protein